MSYDVEGTTRDEEEDPVEWMPKRFNSREMAARVIEGSASFGRK